MFAAVADGMLAIVKAATEPLIGEIKALRAEVAALKAAPPPPGPPGPPGERGAEGAVGPHGATGEPGPPGARGQDGAIGAMGPMGEKGADGLNGRDGIHGKDGVGLASAVLDRYGALVVTMTDGSTKALGVVIGATGAPGRDGMHGTDGADGLGWDDMTEALADDGRTIVRRYQSGETVKEFRHTFPVVLDRGVFAGGTTYAPGDAVTWGGSLFIAQKTTSAKPGESGEASRAWRLAVKRGGDGKPGPKGDPGPTGPRGDQGPQGKSGY